MGRSSSPLSGRVHLEGYCECGWKGFACVSGWFRRGEVLRAQIAADKGRYLKYKLLHPAAKPATVKEFIDWLSNN